MKIRWDITIWTIIIILLFGVHEMNSRQKKKRASKVSTKELVKETPPPEYVRKGMILTILDHPQYKGLYGKPMVVTAVSLPFVHLEHYSETLKTWWKALVDCRETTFKPLDKAYIETVSPETLQRGDASIETPTSPGVK